MRYALDDKHCADMLASMQMDMVAAEKLFDLADRDKSGEVSKVVV